MPDIRKFWKKKNDEEQASKTEKNDRRPTQNLPMEVRKPEPKIKKLDDNKFNRVKNYEKCEFNEMRMCVIHNCIAEKICVKVSRFKKNVGFVKENVIKLKQRSEGSIVSDFSH